jgi:hypothetical protein
LSGYYMTNPSSRQEKKRKLTLASFNLTETLEHSKNSLGLKLSVIQPKAILFPLKRPRPP